MEEKKPAAIIAATERNPESVGALYPFPLFEDGDFNIPSVFMKDIEGVRLMKYVNQRIILKFDSNRIPSKGSNVVARKGGDDQSKIVFLAHIDARKGTPGALDDGGGIATLLVLAELLEEYSGSTGIEIIAFNGEDYYDAPGQKQYLEQNRSALDNIVLAINLDDVGYFDGRTGYSLYGCSEALENRIRKLLSKRPDFMEGEQWYSGDHMIFAFAIYMKENIRQRLPRVASSTKSG